MADAILGELVEQLMGSVYSLIQREVHLFFGVKNDAEKLHRTLSTVRDVLEDAESRKIKDKSLANWLKMLKDAAYDATDALDEWALEAQQPEEQELADTGCTSQVSGSILSCLSVKKKKNHRNMAKKFKKIVSRFDEIAAERSKFHLTKIVVETGSQFDASRETSSTPTEPIIFGRDGDKENIIAMLLSDVCCEENVSICPIVGIGGLGKTTLAQLVYNDDRVKSFFDVKIWVCASNPFDLKRVLKAIVESFEGQACDLENLQTIQSKVNKIIRKKRYLLVLDDVWNENRDEWNRLKNSLMVGNKGSSIIVTTRLDIVASITGTIPKYCLKALSDDDCWCLFKIRAFIDGAEENLILVAIGKEIVKKCKGVPLAAKSLGSLLWSWSDESHWKLVRDSEIWNLEQCDENEILPALRLSYKHLRPQLKRCFAYCSVLPKNNKIDKGELIHLWIANGFVQSAGGREPEDIGNMIFRELLWRSFFQDYDGNRFCMMHDLMHDLASSVMDGDCLSLEGNMKAKEVTKLRHLSLVSSNLLPLSPVLDHILTSQASLHSLIFFRFLCSRQPSMVNLSNVSKHECLRALNLSYMGVETLPSSIWHLKLEQPPMVNLSNVSKHRCLRALNLSYMGVETLPSSICHLKLLRYLNLSHNDITSLPASIHGLRSLQMLDLAFNERLTTLPPSIGTLKSLRYLNLSSCKEITLLPESIGGLRNLKSLILEMCISLQVLPETMRNINRLRHLNVKWCYSLTKMPVGIGELTYLETLNRFLVGRSDSGSRCGGISELKYLNDLRGKLEIGGLENIRSLEEVKKANLGDKRYLTQLDLIWSRLSGNNDRGNNSYIEVLDGYSPLPPHLRDLYICGYPGACLRAFHGNLASVRYLCISKCDSMKCLPMIGIQDLNKNTSMYLAHLGIQYCKILKSVSEGLRYQTSLQTLDIYDCPELELATDDLQHLVSLQSLELEDLPKVTSFPEQIQHLTMLQHLKIWRCKNLSSLPEGLKHLTALQYLRIWDCHPELHRRCEKEKGQDWHIISHIPHLYT